MDKGQEGVVVFVVKLVVWSDMVADFFFFFSRCLFVVLVLL